MGWVRLEDGIGEHPKLAAVDDHAFALYVCGLAYCNRNLTDGFIPTAVGLTLRHSGKTKQAIVALETARLWQAVDGGWRVHDYLDYQPSKQQVELSRGKVRAVRQAAGHLGGLAKAKQTAGKPVANGLANAKQNPGPNPKPKLSTGRLVGRSGGGVGEPRQRGDGGFQPLASAFPPEVLARLARRPIGDRPTDQPTVDLNCSTKTTTAC